MLLSSSITSTRNIRRSQRTTKLQKHPNEFRNLHLRDEVEVTKHQPDLDSIYAKSVASPTHNHLISGSTCVSTKESNHSRAPSKTAIGNSRFALISMITFGSVTRVKGNNLDPNFPFIHLFAFQTIPVHNLRQEIPHRLCLLPASFDSSWRATLRL